MLDLEFMRLAFGAGIVVGLLAPAVGFFLVQRRLSLVGDGIGHVAFAGVALGYLLDPPLVLTAVVVSVAGGLSIEWIRARRRTAGDQALALIFYTGIAGGVVLVSAAGALNVNLFQFLFGSILTVTRGDLAVIAVLGACALAAIALLYRPLVAVVVDEEGARVAGLPVSALNSLTVALAAVTIALSMRVVAIRDPRVQARQGRPSPQQPRTHRVPPRSSVIPRACGAARQRAGRGRTGLRGGGAGSRTARTHRASTRAGASSRRCYTGRL